MAVFSELLELVLPSRCLHCGAAQPSHWCPGCRGAPALTAAGCVPGLELWAGAEYAGAVRAALLHYKERGQRHLAPALAPFLLAALQPFRRHGQQLRIVPVPSTRAAARERGGDHMLRLSRSVARGSLATGAAAVEVFQVLRVRGGGADSAGLTADQRRERTSGLLARAPDRGIDRRIVLVDDIVTTGSTLMRASAALTEAGWLVSGAAVVAATLRRTPVGRR